MQGKDDYREMRRGDIAKTECKADECSTKKSQYTRGNDTVLGKRYKRTGGLPNLNIYPSFNPNSIKHS